MPRSLSQGTLVEHLTLWWCCFRRCHDLQVKSSSSSSPRFSQDPKREIIWAHQLVSSREVATLPPITLLNNNYWGGIDWEGSPRTWKKQEVQSTSNDFDRLILLDQEERINWIAYPSVELRFLSIDMRSLVSQLPFVWGSSHQNMGRWISKEATTLWEKVCLKSHAWKEETLHRRALWSCLYAD